MIAETPVTTYYEVPRGAVPADHRRRAWAVAVAAAMDLDMPTPGLRWFEIGPPPAGSWNVWNDERYLGGFTRADEVGREIWVRADLSLHDLAWTVAHEAHHLSWIRRTGRGYRSPYETEIMEEAAEAFALALVTEWRL